MRALAALLLCAGVAQADVVAEITEGERAIQLHTDAGPCVGAARWALFTDATQRIPGCWVITPQGVQIAFLDGDVLIVPAHLWRKPRTL